MSDWSSDVCSSDLGARLWPDLDIGPGCMVFENATVEPFSRIGANTILRVGVHLSHDAVIGDHVFLAPRVAMAGTGRIESHCFVGVNATLRAEERRVGKECVSQC